MKIVRMRDFSGPYFRTFGLNTVRDGKIRTRKTPNTDAFYAMISLEKRHLYFNPIEKEMKS